MECNPFSLGSFSVIITSLACCCCSFSCCVLCFFTSKLALQKKKSNFVSRCINMGVTLRLLGLRWDNDKCQRQVSYSYEGVPCLLPAVNTASGRFLGVSEYLFSEPCSQCWTRCCQMRGICAPHRRDCTRTDVKKEGGVRGVTRGEILLRCADPRGGGSETLCALRPEP